MSKVYSFRLSDDNPREAQVMGIMEDMVKWGYSLRQIITEALLIGNDKKNGSDEVYTLFEQIKRMISELKNTTNLGINDKPENSRLSSSFMVAVKNSSKYGLRSE